MTGKSVGDKIGAMVHPDVSAIGAKGPCGLYIHIPFCETKCGYCDFYSVPVAGLDRTHFLERLERELGLRVGAYACEVRTIFFGGGTPTILPSTQLVRLLEAISGAVRPDRIDEFTVEANPATVDGEKADVLVRRGVTRVSMGAQSFIARELATLERLHRPEDIERSVAILRRNAVRQVNLDLIFGIPGQTLNTWSYSLNRAISLEPDHIACYGLTYEPGTYLSFLRQQGRITPCDERLEAEMYLRAVEVLREAGFEQYETSNFARPGCQCRHNLIYWRNGPYIGVGPSAAGCIDNRRYKNIADVSGYVRLMDAQGHAEAESELLDESMQMTEMIMMQLRLTEGLSIADVKERTGADAIALFGNVLGRLVDLGHVAVSATHIAVTPKGRLISDAIISELVISCGGAK